MSMRLRPLLGAVLLAGAAVVGCSDDQGFVEPEQRSQAVVDFENVVMPGQGKQVFRATVLPEPDMMHPHFEGSWTIQDSEKPIDVYVFTAAAYNDTQPPNQQQPYWSSLQDAVVGQQRSTAMFLHPAPGDWVFVFYNPAPNVNTARSQISSEINITYFK